MRKIRDVVGVLMIAAAIALPLGLAGIAAYLLIDIEWQLFSAGTDGNLAEP